MQIFAVTSEKSKEAAETDNISIGKNVKIANTEHSGRAELTIGSFANKQTGN